jgi:hypothetical protein
VANVYKYYVAYSLASRVTDNDAVIMGGASATDLHGAASVYAQRTPD